MSVFPKTCTCCKRTYTSAQWRDLKYPVGGKTMPDGDDGLLELKQCVCQSTLAVPLITRARPSNSEVPHA